MTKSIMLANRIPVKIDYIYLDSYSYKKYKLPYNENEEKVNSDIKNLSEKYRTTKTRDIYMLILSEHLPLKERKEYINKYSKEISKFILI